MAYLNQCFFIGYATGEPEIKQSKISIIAKFSINVIRNVSKESGIKKQDTEVIPVVAFSTQALVAQKLITKGTCVYVSGRLRTRARGEDGAETGHPFDIVANNVQPVGRLSFEKSQEEVG